jgi:hypothetical protein
MPFTLQGKAIKNAPKQPKNTKPTPTYIKLFLTLLMLLKMRLN